MATAITTVSLAGIFHLPVSRAKDTTVLGRTPFLDQNTQNFWLARITPPARDQRHDAYARSPRREFERRYLAPVQGLKRHEIDVKDLSYGFAYEFGGDRVNLDKRIPHRIYCVFLGTNGTGTEADFQVYDSALSAMQAERRMREQPDQQVTAASTLPAPKPSTLHPLPEDLAKRLTRMYCDMANNVNAIGVVEKQLLAAGYATPSADDAARTGLLQEAIQQGRNYGQMVWEEVYKPVVLAETARRQNAAIEEGERLGLEARRRDDAAAAATAPVSLLDTIAEAHEAPAPTGHPVPHTAAQEAAIGTTTRELKALQTRATAERRANAARRLTKPQVIAAAKASIAAKPTGPRPVSEPHKVSAPSPAGTVARPAHIPAPAGDDLPF